MKQNIGWEKRINQYFDAIGNNGIEADIRKVFSDASDESKLYILAIVPALIAFVNWVLDEAVKTNKTRLYFLSRDGYQMYLIAKRLVRIENINLECRYLKVSRYSMRLPGYHLDLDKSVDEICVGGIDITYHKILRRGGLSDTECEVVIEDIGLKDDSERILNYREVLKLRNSLRTNELIRKYIKHYSMNAYDSAAKYLEQEGLMTDDRYAIVDSGWIGTLQCSIERIVKSVKPEINIEGYYFGMYETPVGTDKSKFHPYYFGAKAGVGRKAAFSNSLFETIVSATEGMTIGYKQDSETICPVENNVINPNGRLISDNIKALNRLLDTMRHHDDWANIDIKTINRLFDLFMVKPSTYEVKLYGDCKFSDDVVDGNFKKVAAELTYEQIKDQRFLNKLIIISGLRKRTIYESAWLEGSTVRCGKNVKYSLRHIRLYKLFIYLKKQLLS